MRRFLAYVVMRLTVIGALIFNTQAVFSQDSSIRSDTGEFSPSTTLVYSLNNRVAEDYDLEKYPDRKNNGVKTLDEIDVEGEVRKRLDAAGVRNANVKIVHGDENGKGNQLRITISPLNTQELNNVKEIISVTGSFSVGTIADETVRYEANDEFFNTEKDLAAISYNGTTPYPTLHVKKADYDTLKTKAKEAYDNNNKTQDDSDNARKFYADGDSTTNDASSESETTVYLWSNKTKNDTYYKAFGKGTSDHVDEEVKAKIIAKIDLANYDEENEALPITSTMDGEGFTISSARAFVNRLNAEDYGFEISSLYVEPAVPAWFGPSALKKTYIVAIVAIAVLSILRIALYGLAGVTSSLTRMLSILVTVTLFSYLGFEFSIAAISALAVLIALSALISINYFRLVKEGMKKGYDRVKANKEGYHRSFFNALDVSATLLFGSIFSFLVASGAYKTFFGVLRIGSIFTFLITNYFNKWMISWLLKGYNENSRVPYFGFSHVKKEAALPEIKVSSANKKHFTKWTSIVIPAISAVALAVGLPLGYFRNSSKGFFNNSGDFSSSYVLNIEFRDNDREYNNLSSTREYLEYIEKIGKVGESSENAGVGTFKAYSDENKEKVDGTDTFFYYPDTAYVSIEKKTDGEGQVYYRHYFTVDINKDLTTVKDANGTTALNVLENVRGVHNDGILVTLDDRTPINPTAFGHYVDGSLRIFSSLATPTNVSHNTRNLFLLAFVVSCFCFCYTLLRFGLSISLTQLCSGTVMGALAIGLLATLRIPFSSYTGFGILVAVLLINRLSVILLAPCKQTLKELGIKKSATPEQRATIINESASRSLHVIYPLLTVILALGISFFFRNQDLFGLGIARIVFSILSVFVLYLFAAPLYHFFSSKISFTKLSAKREARREKKEGKAKLSKEGIRYVEPDLPHETIIPGLNEFRNRK